jgi:nucleoporin POM34
VAVLPLVRKKDDLSDIALTPAQRQLLGLAPSSTPPPPGSTYVTPPRYVRSSTPRSGSPGSRSINSGSPLSGKAYGGNDYSQNASPLLQKAMGASMGGSRRLSYGSSPLGPSSARSSSFDAPGTPTPANKGASVGLNSRWLYEKGRSSPGGGRVFS